MKLPTVTDDRELPLLHVQDAAATLITLCEEPVSGSVEPAGRPTYISSALERLSAFRQTYASGEIPDISDTL